MPLPVAAPAATDDAIKEKVLEIVAEKSGYPKDMLDLDLDLEADLGIDTVKQAEMFAAVRAAYNIPRDENLKLRELPNPGPRDQVRSRPTARRTKALQALPPCKRNPNRHRKNR